MRQAVFGNLTSPLKACLKKFNLSKIKEIDDF